MNRVEFERLCTEQVRDLLWLQEEAAFEDVQKLRGRLEEIIGIALNEFTAQTGLKVDYVNLDHIETTAMASSKRTICYRVKADVRL